jgi:hypothetical protein
VLNTDPAPPSKRRPGVPRDLETICLKAMAKRPADRYPTCAVLAADLRRWLDGEPISARRLSAAERVGRWARKNRAVAGLAAAVFLALAVGAVVSTVFAVQAGVQAVRARAAEADADRRRAEAEEAGGRATAAAAKLEAALADAEAGRKAAVKAQADADVQRRIAETREKDAGREKKLADEARKAADDEKAKVLEALADRDRAEADRKKADAAFAQSRAEAERLAYALLFQRARRAAEARTFAEAGRFLRLCPPDQRGWEWQFLSAAVGKKLSPTAGSLCDREKLPVVPFLAAFRPTGEAVAVAALPPSGGGRNDWRVGICEAPRKWQFALTLAVKEDGVREVGFGPGGSVTAAVHGGKKLLVSGPNGTWETLLDGWYPRSDGFAPDFRRGVLVYPTCDVVTSGVAVPGPAATGPDPQNPRPVYDLDRFGTSDDGEWVVTTKGAVHRWENNVLRPLTPEQVREATGKDFSFAWLATANPPASATRDYGLGVVKPGPGLRWVALAAARGWGVRVYHGGGADGVRPVEGVIGEPLAIRPTPDGRRIFLGSADGPVQVVDPDTGEHLMDLPKPDGKLLDLAFDPKANAVRVVTATGLVGTWSAPTASEEGSVRKK